MGRKKEGIICKLDMEKAYHHVSWDFVDYMLDRLSFGLKWRKWILACITISSFAVIINGGPSSFFKAFRGLRQGDPLSPLLFIVVMEAFNRMIEHAKESDLFKGVMVERSDQQVEVSHLLLQMIRSFSANQIRG